MSATTKQDRQHKREAGRQERLRRLLSSVPHVRIAAQVFTEEASREATAIATRTQRAKQC